MKIYLICLIVALILSLAITAALLPLLRRLKAGQYILGYVKEHKNKAGTPTMGGLGFVTCIILCAIFFYGIHDRDINLTLAITAAFMLVGFLDDFLKIYRKENEGLKPYQKILFQVAIAVVAATYCYITQKTLLYIPFVGDLKCDISWGIIPFALFIFIATVNCVNLCDGLDGLAAGTSCAYLLTFGIMLALQGAKQDKMCFIAVGALCGFLLFNANRASVFMGDTGSLALGGLISCISIFSGNSLYIPLFGIMFVISGITVIIQVIYYKRTKRRIFLMSPIHHHFQMKGFTECKISYAYFLITAFVGIICLIFV